MMYHLFFQFIFKTGVEELRTRYGVSSVILIHTVGSAVGGGVAELETRGGFVHCLNSSDLVDNNVELIVVIISTNVFIKSKNIRELVFSTGKVEFGIE